MREKRSQASMQFLFLQEPTRLIGKAMARWTTWERWSTETETPVRFLSGILSTPSNKLKKPKSQ
ncbi:hypothetical protein PG999_006194 [Apiospora kogelbergensis]|uniref:Uncharacterized protein n=1 Tax=Apiospora kogelbergensis TaxID=1337665 RepID=A0AAW0QPT5_9PEZI